MTNVVASYSAAALAGRRLPGEQPPAIDQAALQRPVRERVCSWCFTPLARGQPVAAWNGGRGHPRCARSAAEAVLGAEALPWPPTTVATSAEVIIAFCSHLGNAAARAGISAEQLEQAVTWALVR
jgi:hypothetical protein